MSDPIQAAEDAIARVSRYVRGRIKKPIKNLGDSIHHIHPGDDYEAELTVSDLQALLAELARKSTVADAYWEIVESFRAENEELRQAWEKVRAEIEALAATPIHPFLAAGMRRALAILARHAPEAGKEADNADDEDAARADEQWFFDAEGKP